MEASESMKLWKGWELYSILDHIFLKILFFCIRQTWKLCCCSAEFGPIRRLTPMRTITIASNKYFSNYVWVCSTKKKCILLVNQCRQPWIFPCHSLEILNFCTYSLSVHCWQHVSENTMEMKIVISFGRRDCCILVWHVAFLCTQWSLAMYPLSTLACHLACGIFTSLCSHTCAVAQPTYEAKAKKQVGHIAVRDWNGRPHASPSVDNTRVCLETLSPGYSKHDSMEHPGGMWHALSVQEWIIVENMLLIFTEEFSNSPACYWTPVTCNKGCKLMKSGTLLLNIENDVTMI